MQYKGFRIEVKEVEQGFVSLVFSKKYPKTAIQIEAKSWLSEKSAVLAAKNYVQWRMGSR